MPTTSSQTWRLQLNELAAHKDAIALEGVGPKLSYQQLASRAESLANFLRSAGIGPGDRVALLSAKRQHDEACALVGVHLAQATAVPLDASSPPKRLQQIMRSSGCRALLHDGATKADDIVEGLLSITLDEGGTISATRGSLPKSSAEVDPEVACILHTSGSTGTPKAIDISHRGLDVFTNFMIGLTGLEVGQRVLRVAELVFDLAWFDHLATFRAGATLCTLSRRELASGRSAARSIATLRPNVIYGVPGLFIKIAASLGEQELPAALRVVCFAGEVFPPRELLRFAECAPTAKLYNLYGPTETNVCTYQEVDRAHLDGRSELPIGEPCPYAHCELIDASGGIIEGAGVGELVVHGPTALGGCFATRDRVVRDATGRYYFRGRLDRMMKLRGYRVEPGEVEAALVSHPSVSEAAAFAVDEPRLGLVLHAAVRSLAGQAPPEPRLLRKYLASRLAPYMVPEKIRIMDELPRTTSGKIDLAALIAG